jgi:hypothetical protein
MLIRIDNPKGRKFVVGVVIRDGDVVLAAPKVSFMLGWPKWKVLTYAKRQGWGCLELPDPNVPGDHPSRATSGKV